MRLNKFFQKAATVSLLPVIVASVLSFNVLSTEASNPQGTTTQIRLLDTNTNGKIDRVELTIANPNTTVWSAGTLGSTVTQSGNDITISSVSISGSVSANPIIVNVDLDESDPDLLVNTDGVISGDMEYVYVQQGVTNGGIDDTTDELNAIASGDSGTTDNEIDAAAPIMTHAFADDGNSDGTIDQIQIDFSENINITDGNAGDAFTGLSLTASSGTATINNGDYAVNNTNIVIFPVTESAFGTDVTIDPTYVSAGTEDIFDAANLNEMNNGSTVAGQDAAPPIMTDAITKDGNSDGTIDQLQIDFSEPVDVTDGNAGDGFTGLSLVASSGTATIDNADYAQAGVSSVTFNITVSDTNKTDLLITPTYNVVGTEDFSDSVPTEMLDGATVAGTDGAAPFVNIVTPVDGGNTHLANPLIVTTTEDATCTYNTDSHGAFPMDVTGTTYHTDILSGFTPLAPGAHSVTVACTDSSANTGNATSNWTRNAVGRTVMYGVDGASNNPTPNLYTLDPESGTISSTVGPTGHDLTGLASNPLTTKLYGTSGGNDFAGNPTSLFEINKETGAATLLGDTGKVFADISFKSNGTLYGWSETGDDLYTINIGSCNGVTCNVTKVAESGLNTSGSGLAFDSSDNLFQFGGRDDSFNTINPATGLLIANIPFLNPSGDSRPIAAAKFDDTDMLFASRLNSGDPSDLIVIDPINGIIVSMEAGDNSDMELMDAIAIVTNGPDINIVAPANNGSTKMADPLMITTDETADCSYKLDGGVLTPVANTSSTVHTDNFVGLADGSHSVTISCQDVAGNFSYKTSDWTKQSVGNTVLYGADGAGGNANTHLFILNPETGSKVTDVGPIGFSLTGLAQDPVSGALYGTTGNSGPNIRKLVRIDTSSGAGTLLGTTTESGPATVLFPDIAFNSAGVLYGWSEGTDDLYIIDINSCNGSTCNVASVGDSTLSTPGGGLAFDSTNNLYLFADKDDDFEQLNPATGLSTAHTSFLNPSGSSYAIAAAKFDSTNMLFASRLNSGGAPSDLIAIDPVNGIIASLGGNNPDMRKMDAITFFTPHSSGGGIGHGSATVTVTVPNGGETWANGTSKAITWSSSGFTIAGVRVSLSIDGGANYVVLADNQPNSGSYVWPVSASATSLARVRVEALDSSNGVIATDDSDANFTITTSAITPPSGGGGGNGGGSPPPTPPSPTSPPPSPFQTTPPFVPTPTGLSQTQLLNQLQTMNIAVHSLIKLADDGNNATQADQTVYYVGADGQRHVFPSSKVYFTWYCDFSNVKIVSPDSLASIPLGHNVNYRPGLKMVKFTTSAIVYVVDTGGVLRPIANETVASQLYGPAWNKNIDDLSDTDFTSYTFGPSIDTSSQFDVAAKIASVATPSSVLNIAGFSETGVAFNCPVKLNLTGIPVTFRFTTNLSIGSTNLLAVRYLQVFMRALGTSIYTGGTSGSFGTLTQTGVKNFQAAHGLVQTGIVDAPTRVVINAMLDISFSH